MHKHQRTIKMNADGAWMGGHSISTQPSVSYDILSLVPVTVMERPPTCPPSAPRAVYKSNLLSIIMAICHLLKCQWVRQSGVPAPVHGELRLPL